MNWFETHDKLAGWAQAFGALLTLALTLRLAWRRKREAQAAVADRVRALARLFGFQHETCARSYRLRQAQGAGPTDVAALNIHLEEFNFVCGELNQFKFKEAPSATVVHVMIDYRRSCNPLSEMMHPNHEWVATDDLKTFADLIRAVEDREQTLTAEADRIEHRGQ